DIEAGRTPEVIEGADLPQPLESHARRDAQHDEEPVVDLDLVRPAHETALSTEVAEAAHVAQVIRTSEYMRLKLSRWQSLGAVLMVLGIVIGAAGVAAYATVAVHDWSCRTGLVQSYCPATPAVRPGSRSDIPA